MDDDIFTLEEEISRIEAWKIRNERQIRAIRYKVQDLQIANPDSPATEESLRDLDELIRLSQMDEQAARYLEAKKEKLRKLKAPLG